MPCAIETIRLLNRGINFWSRNAVRRIARPCTKSNKSEIPRTQPLSGFLRWQLLSPDERHVFSRLALFRGGFLAEAAFEVAGATLAVLRALCDQSLLQREPAGRYTVHELVRRFAAERLAAAGLADETARRHLLYFVALAETAEPHLRSAGQAPWLGRLALEHGNLAAALDWALAHGEIEWMARLSGATRSVRSCFARLSSRAFFLKPPQPADFAAPLRIDIQGNAR